MDEQEQPLRKNMKLSQEQLKYLSNFADELMMAHGNQVHFYIGDRTGLRSLINACVHKTTVEHVVKEEKYVLKLPPA